MNKTAVRYIVAAMFVILGISARGERKEMPEFKNLVVVGNVTVFFTPGDYPGYIDMEGSGDGVTSVWGNSSLVLVIGDKPPKAIRIRSRELSSVTLTANTTFISDGGMESENITLTGTDHCTFNIPKLSAEKIAICLNDKSSVNIGKTIGEKLSLSSMDNSSMEINGIEAETVSAVAGDKSVMDLSGRCGKKNMVLINGGIINTKGLIEDGATYVHKGVKGNNRTSRKNREPLVNMP